MSSRVPWRAAPLPRAAASSRPPPATSCIVLLSPAAAAAELPTVSRTRGAVPPLQTPADPPSSIWLEAGTLPGPVPRDASLAQAHAAWVRSAWPLEKTFCRFPRAAEGPVSEELAACAGVGLPHTKPGRVAGVLSCRKARRGSKRALQGSPQGCRHWSCPEVHRSYFTSRHSFSRCVRKSLPVLTHGDDAVSNLGRGFRAFVSGPANRADAQSANRW